MLATQVSRRRVRDDGGFSLMEAVVSATLLGVAAAVVATMMIGTLKVSTDSGRRTAAAELAAGQLATVRQLRATDIPDGKVTVATTTVGGTEYTVTQEATYVTYAGATSACSGTGKLAAKRVTVSVTWSGMGNTKPVTSETLRGLGFDAASGGLDTAKGSAAVYVADADGDPVDGAQVVLKTGGGAILGSQATGGDGCVVFTNLAASTNVYASASRSGYVDLNGYDTASDTGSGVVAASLVKSTLQLDRPGALAVTMALPAGTVLPASYSTTAFKPFVGSSIWPSISAVRNPPDCSVASPSQVCTTGTTTSGTTVTRLLPAAYGAWFGSCQDAKPGTVQLNAVTAGATTTATATLAGVQLGPAAAGAVGKLVTATHTADSSCTAGETIVVGTLPAMGSTISVALPPGAWKLTVPSGTAPRSLTLSSGAITSTTVG